MSTSDAAAIPAQSVVDDAAGAASGFAGAHPGTLPNSGGGGGLGMTTLRNGPGNTAGTGATAEAGTAAASGSASEHHTNGSVGEGGGATLEVDVLVIGAGPTGLGAATRLQQHNHQSWLVVDGFSQPGGLARSEMTREGFLFDLGGHVIFSHYKYFDQLLEHAMGTGADVWSTIERVSYVWIKDRYVPYPFQNNLSVLDIEDQIACLEGLIDSNFTASSTTGTQSGPNNFDDWMVHVMGKSRREEKRKMQSAVRAGSYRRTDILGKAKDCVKGVSVCATGYV